MNLSPASAPAVSSIRITKKIDRLAIHLSPSSDARATGSVDVTEQLEPHLTTHLSVTATEPYSAAIRDIVALLAAFRVDHAFAGSVARAAWLGETVAAGSLEVLVLTMADRAGQLPVMASNRGFRVERDEVEATEELDLVPLHHGEVTIHLLLSTNALYGRMIRSAVNADLAGVGLRVVNAEDQAVLLSVADDERSRNLRERLAALEGFDRRVFNERLISIGLGGKVLRS